MKVTFESYRVTRGRGYRVFYTNIPVPPKRKLASGGRKDIDREFLKTLPLDSSFWNHRGFGYYSQLAAELGISLTERVMPNGKIMTWRIL